jgi:hypothetical protein
MKMKQSNSNVPSGIMVGQAEQELQNRLFAAWFKSGGLEQPSTADAYTIDGKEYAVLYNTNGVLAVYDVSDDGRLKRLEQYPEEINENYA